MIHNVATNRIPPGIIIAGSRLSVLITAHGLKAETDRVPSEDLAPRHALTICSMALCDLVLRLPRFLPSPCFVQRFEKRLDKMCLRSKIWTSNKHAFLVTISKHDVTCDKRFFFVTSSFLYQITICDKISVQKQCSSLHFLRK